MTTKLNLLNKLLPSFFRCWPFYRGKTKLTKISEKICNFPESATFKFKYGKFADVSIREWPYGYRELFLWGEMEISETRAWKRIVNQGDIIIDGGANQGYYTLLGSYLAGKSGSVISFEPIPKTVGSLRRNIQASGADNVTIVEHALMDKNDTIFLKMFSDDFIGGQSSIGYRDKMDCIQEIECKASSIDSYVEQNNITKCSLIKLDIEGGEYFAIQGATKTIQKLRPVIVFEWNVETASACNYHPDKILGYLDNCNYLPYVATLNSFIPFQKREIKEWTPMVWCFPKEKEQWKK